MANASKCVATAGSAAEIVAWTDPLVKIRSYAMPAWHRFPPCAWCHGTPRPATLTWWWDRPSHTTDGAADTCADRACVETAFEAALEDTGGRPEGITIEHPEIAAPDAPALAA